MFRIKICGITNAFDACRAKLAGADAIGLNFYTRSLRHVTTADARKIIEEVRRDDLGIDSSVAVVGVFVNQSIAEIQDAVAHTKIDMVQLHGDEDPGQFRDVDFPFLRAIRCGDLENSQIEQRIENWREAGAAAVLLDSAFGKKYGGTGVALEWDTIAGVRASIPTILAGGLNASNVSRAVEVVQPQAVDIASGVENFPGKKDPAAMQEFIANARKAFAELAT